MACGAMLSSLIQTNRVPEGLEKENMEKIFEETIIKNLPNVMKNINLLFQEFIASQAG